MIDSEVLRLRKLRNVALRARALGKFLGSNANATDSVFAKGTVISWTIARIATGRLRAHPYLSYQKGHGELAAWLDDTIAAATAALARRQDRAMRVYAEQLQVLAAELDDVRALTWSPDLSDALGRMQAQLNKLTNELECHLPKRTRAAARPRVHGVLSAATRNSLDGLAVESNWPYLAI